MVCAQRSPAALAVLALFLALFCQPALASVVLEQFTDRDAFVARLGGVTVMDVNFDDIETPLHDPVAFDSDRYRYDLGAIITGANEGGQYVSRGFNWEWWDYYAVSSPNSYAPGPVCGENVVTDVTFASTIFPGKVAGFGLYFLDPDHPAVAPSYFDLYGTTGELLGSSGTVSGANGSQVFHGVIAIDTETNQPTPVVARVQIHSGGAWPDQTYTEGVAMDDFVFDEPTLNLAAPPEPATLALLALGGAIVLGRRRRR